MQTLDNEDGPVLSWEEQFVANKRADTSTLEEREQEFHEALAKVDVRRIEDGKQPITRENKFPSDSPRC